MQNFVKYLHKINCLIDDSSLICISSLHTFIVPGTPADSTNPINEDADQIVNNSIEMYDRSIEMFDLQMFDETNYMQDNMMSDQVADLDVTPDQVAEVSVEVSGEISDLLTDDVMFDQVQVVGNRSERVTVTMPDQLRGIC